jgi:Arc/MetJ-type ribon-helix-helix transcriptional regulator
MEIVKINKSELYKALLESLKDKEDYELCAKLRDALKELENPEEFIELDLDEFKNKGGKI